MTVVKDLAQLDGDELVTERTDIPIKSQTLDVHVSNTENCGGGRLVASTRFDTNETVLYDIDTANTVFAGKSIESQEDVHRIGVGLVSSRDFDREACLELDGNALGSVGRILGRRGQLPHVSWWRDIRVLKNSGFVGNVEKVLIC